MKHTASPQVQFAIHHLKTLRPPPPHQVFGIGKRIKHQLLRCIEAARDHKNFVGVFYDFAFHIICACSFFYQQPASWPVSPANNYPKPPISRSRVSCTALPNPIPHSTAPAWPRKTAHGPVV